MAKYEAVFILDPRRIEGSGEAFSNAVEAQIKALGGTVTRVKCLEKKMFARPIGKHRAGVYWDYVVETDGDLSAQLYDKYHLNETVLRLAVFHYEDGQDDDVFKPREERMFKDDGFPEEFDRDDRPYRGGYRR